MLYIGVDLGTSAVKLLLMDEKGGIKKIVSKEYDLYFPHPGWSEQKPEDWYSQSMEGIKGVYDWSVLVEILDGEDYLSFAKVKAYEKHGKKMYIW